MAQTGQDYFENYDGSTGGFNLISNNPESEPVPSFVTSPKLVISRKFLKRQWKILDHYKDLDKGINGARLS